MYRNKFKLRRLVAVAICLSSSVTMFSQDIIIKRNGDEIQAVVKEVGTDEVKYKRFDNPQGPNYTLRKSEIFMIRYENGSKDVFDTPTPKETQQQTIVSLRATPYERNVNFQQQHPVLRYTFGEQISSYGSEKSSSLAGFLSFLIPGVGQFYNGDVGGGFLFLGCNVLCNAVWISSRKVDPYGHVYFEPTQFFIGLIGAVVVNVGSIVHASRGAKKVNIARGYRLAGNTYLKIQPTMIQQNNLLASNGYAFGMNFCINF